MKTDKGFEIADEQRSLLINQAEDAILDLLALLNMPPRDGLTACLGVAARVLAESSASTEQLRAEWADYMCAEIDQIRAMNRDGGLRN